MGNVGNWPALDVEQILTHLERLVVRRDHMEFLETELLDAAQHAGVPWERIDAAYAPVAASTAKRRYLDLASRVSYHSLIAKPQPRQPPQPD